MIVLHSINIEEKGEKEIKDGFILAQFFEDISEALKATLDRGAYRFNIVNLFIIFLKAAASRPATIQHLKGMQLQLPQQSTVRSALRTAQG